MALIQISDDDLRDRLLRFNFPVPPITASTRDVLKNKLKNLEEADRKKRSSTGRKKNIINVHNTMMVGFNI